MKLPLNRCGRSKSDRRSWRRDRADFPDDEPDVRHVRFAAAGGAAGIGRTRVLRARVGVGQVELEAFGHPLQEVELERVVERTSGVGQQDRLRNVEAEIGARASNRITAPPAFARL